ncbi:hypothetical protein F3K02_03270 [Hydrogenophaga sp. D2P1]|uniref:Uncharacterized protein n=1 Tax=Hydrogenophaga aromaticivorans TaxID=2610898 RepID=A0A7Y8KW90_9BURK|nr:hypothetical protein [Hydrogenophaga aromaticivorans]NWF44277.1 hypothetical protein [Hydrogenophaga aromaticivorans]
MASLAWLLERRLAPLAETGGRAHMECLRLRAIVALMWWERLLPQALSGWSLSDAERLVAAEVEHEWDAEAVAVGGHDRGLVSLLVRGPARAVLDWIEAAGIRGGPVFRRIKPDGQVRTGALTPVGIGSLFASLLMEGRNVGVIDRQFSLDFSKKSPTFPRKRPSYPPIGRDDARGREGRAVAPGGGVLGLPAGGWVMPPRAELLDIVSEGGHDCL